MAEDTKVCIACAEEIKAEALLCKHCKTRQDDASFAVLKSEDLPSDELDLDLFASSCAALELIEGLTVFTFQKENETTSFAISTNKMDFFQPQDLPRIEELLENLESTNRVLSDWQPIEEDDDEDDDSQRAYTFRFPLVDSFKKKEFLSETIASLKKSESSSVGFEGRKVSFVLHALSSTLRLSYCEHSFKDLDGWDQKCTKCKLPVAHPRYYLEEFQGLESEVTGDSGVQDSDAELESPIEDSQVETLIFEAAALFEMSNPFTRIEFYFDGAIPTSHFFGKYSGNEDDAWPCDDYFETADSQKLFDFLTTNKTHKVTASAMAKDTEGRNAVKLTFETIKIENLTDAEKRFALWNQVYMAEERSVRGIHFSDASWFLLNLTDLDKCSHVFEMGDRGYSVCTNCPLEVENVWLFGKFFKVMSY